MSIKLALKRTKQLKSRHFEERNTGACNHDETCEQCKAETKKLQDVVVKALWPYMDARVALAAALVEYEKERKIAQLLLSNEATPEGSQA